MGIELNNEEMLKLWVLANKIGLTINQRKKIQRLVAKKLRIGGITLVGCLRNSSSYDGKEQVCCCNKLIIGKRGDGEHVCLRARDLKQLAFVSFSFG